MKPVTGNFTGYRLTGKITGYRFHFQITDYRLTSNRLTTLIIISCQSAATSEVVKHIRSSRVWLMQEALYQAPDLYPLSVSFILQDLGKFGIAPKVIATKENFASNERERKRKADISSTLAGESVIAGAESVFVDLVLPRK